ncbi:dipeptidase [Tautonia marina]|uniref:dipeptidase n=1 Tax=Tautonia marina TaxID=2653855 RepID=UPI001261342A|nr:membrane dipeptidase [Tautonia marina]
MHRRGFLGTSAALAMAGTAWHAHAGMENEAPSRLVARREPDPKIARARDVALGLMKPTGKELEHGLRLHAESLVFDAYGFAPRAAIDGDAVRAAVEAGASAIEVQDLTEDMSMTRPAIDPAEQADFEAAWEASGVTCIFQNAGEEGQDPLRLMKRLARFTYLTDMLPETLRRAASPDDILAAKEQGKHCLYLTGNGVPLTQQWVSVQDELRYVRVFFQLGIRMMHLTYNRRNLIGDGCAEPANAGLSDFGRAVVAEMHRLGVIPDVAHSGWQTSLEAAQLSDHPVVASHTTCEALHRHIRSKPDQVIRAIVDTGGYVGICCIPRFLGGKGDINAFLDHIDYAIRRFGADHVAIGTDVAYSSRASATENRKVPSRGPRRDRWEALWPDDPYVTTPEATESLSWTNWPLFTVGMVQRGHSDDTIRNVLGGNVLRVARQAFQRSLGK